MTRRPLSSCVRGSAAAEMALVLPLMILLLFGAVELGRYFHNEHVVVKAVRDGARYAARQDFAHYPACSGAPGGTIVADTRNLVMTGLRSGGTNNLPNWNAATITLSVSCSTTAGGQTMSGIYRGRDVTGDGQPDAPIVTVSASVPYTPLFGTMIFGSLNLNATQQATVAGI